MRVRYDREESVAGAVLVASSQDLDHRMLEEILRDLPWAVAHARSCDSAIDVLSRRPVSVVIADRDLPVTGWRELLERMEDLDHPPKLVVSSPFADDRLWCEVLNLGGYDVLLAPFVEREVAWVMESAAGNRLGQCLLTGCCV